MSGRQAKRHGRVSRARGPMPRIAVALAIACAGGVGGLVLASYATGGTRSYSSAASFDGFASSDGMTADHDPVLDVGLSGPEPGEYRCRGCGPGLAARMAAHYDASYYDSAAHDYGTRYAADGDGYAAGQDEAGLAGNPLPAYRPLPFDRPTTTPAAAESPAPLPAASARYAQPPAVKPLPMGAVSRSQALPPLSADRLPVAPGDRLLAPATPQDQPAGGQAQEQQR